MQRYNNCHLEDEFTVHLNQHYAPSDIAVIWFGIIAVPIMWWGYRPTVGLSLVYILFIGYSLGLLWLIVWQRRLYISHREPCIVTLHIIGYFLTAAYTPLPLAVSHATSPWATLTTLRKLSDFVRYSKAFNVLFYSWALPVRLKTHLYRSIISLVIFAATTPVVCHLALSLEIIKADDIPLTSRSTACVVGKSTSVLHPAFDPMTVCTGALVCAQVVMGVLLSCAVVAYLERTQRKNFSRRVGHQAATVLLDVWPSDNLQCMLLELLVKLLVLSYYTNLWEVLSTLAFQDGQLAFNI